MSVYLVLSLYHAGKCLEDATLIAKELNDPMEIANLAERACQLYQLHGMYTSVKFKCL